MIINLIILLLFIVFVYHVLKMTIKFYKKFNEFYDIETKKEDIKIVNAMVKDITDFQNKNGDIIKNQEENKKEIEKFIK